MNGFEKRMLAAALSGVLLASGSATWAIDIADVQVTQWFGSGSNQALMVMDWQQPRTIVFGYHWDGAATGLDFLNAINDANVGFVRVWHPNYVNASIFGMGYDVNGNGSSFVTGTPGLHTETGYATDPADYYAEGWYASGYWSYYLGMDGVNWSYSGASLAHELVDGGWDGWSWSPAPSWDGGLPDNIPLVPEPSTVLVLLAGISLIRARRSRG